MILWRYIVFRHFVSTILGESMEAVKSFGTLWHLCLFVWSSILIVVVGGHVSTWVRQVNNGLFLFSVSMLLLYYYFLKNLKISRRVWFRKIRNFAKILLFATTPVFFVLNMWIPIQRKVSCTFKFFYPTDYDPSKEICPYMSVLLASVFTVLVMVHEKKEPEEYKESGKMKAVTRKN